MNEKRKSTRNHSLPASLEQPVLVCGTFVSLKAKYTHSLLPPPIYFQNKNLWYHLFHQKYPSSFSRQVVKFLQVTWSLSQLSTLPMHQESRHRPNANEWAWLCSNKTLFTKIRYWANLGHSLLTCALKNIWWGKDRLERK